jgi:hypothetical protein
MVMTSRVLLALAAAALAGCSTEFLPQEYLNDARILAVVSDPTEVGPGEQVTLTPYVYEPPLAPGVPAATRAWSFCPLTLGSGNAFACAVAECETPVTPLPDGTVREDPSALALACVQKLTQSGTPLPGTGGQLPEVIETVFRLTVTTAEGLVRESVTRVPLHLAGPPASRNLPPVLTGVDLDGVPATAGAVGATIPRDGGQVRIVAHVDPASIETFVDGNGRTVQETVVVSFFATAGRLDYPRASAPDAEDLLTAKELEPGQDGAELWVVVRDLRGGVAVGGPYLVDFSG